MATIVLVLIMILPGEKPVIYENRDIGTLGACIAVAHEFLDRAIRVPRNTDAHYQAGCSVVTPSAKDAQATDPPTEPDRNL